MGVGLVDHVATVERRLRQVGGQGVSGVFGRCIEAWLVDCAQGALRTGKAALTSGGKVDELICSRLGVLVQQLDRRRNGRGAA
jgi:hypothetical protein